MLIPNCPLVLPSVVSEGVLQFAAAWAASDVRPRPTAEVVACWEHLVEEWCASDVPLFVRKDAERHRGEVRHSTGRVMVPCDNSVAVWAFSLALNGQCPTITEVEALVREQRIPTRLTRLGKLNRFYQAGWKLAHVAGVGLRTPVPIDQIPEEVLLEHHRRLVSPGNLYVVPKRWAGIGEIPEVTQVVAEHDERGRVAAGYPSAAFSQRQSKHVRGSDVTRAAYRAPRLTFRAEVIEPLAPEEEFAIETPAGCFRLTKAQFYETFANVAASRSYQEKRLYSYNVTPSKAAQFLVKSPEADQSR